MVLSMRGVHLDRGRGGPSWATRPRWFQLYWPNDRGIDGSLVQRAEAAGYGAIVVTLDTWHARLAAA